MRHGYVLQFFFTVGLLSLGLITGGCGKGELPTDSSLNAQALQEQGKERQRANDVDGAIESYHQALEADASLPKAHLELGLLFDQYREDYVRAIYHYRRYLELDPEAEKREFVEELIRFARLSFAESLPNTTSEAVQEITRLKGQITRLEEDLADSRKVISDQKVQLKNAEARLAQAARRPVLETPEPPSEVVNVTSSEQRTYKVKSRDNLSRIASKVYNDSSQWRRIYDANRDTLKKPEDLRVDQILVIPD